MRKYDAAFDKYGDKYNEYFKLSELKAYKRLL